MSVRDEGFKILTIMTVYKDANIKANPQVAIWWLAPV